MTRPPERFQIEVGKVVPVGLFSWIDKSIEAKKVQAGLTEAFAKRGLNFMQMHPSVHRALLKEAIIFKRIDRTVEMFFEVAQAGYEQGLDDYGVASYVKDVYKERLDLYL